jgi:cell division transport system permease protein
MTLLQAFAYFYREAAVSLVRSWRVSLLAIVTIGVSLFIGGSVLLVRANVLELVERWRAESKVLVYLEAGADPGGMVELERRLREPAWVQDVRLVTPEQAVFRFQQTFPSLADLVAGWSEEPLPASFEVGIDPRLAVGREFDSWIAALRSDPTITMVDDDRDWLRQLDSVLTVLGSVGLALAVVLLAAAMFTIASVVRLTAHLYREEIAIMRLVGATEFYIRGPFYVEGLLQGLLGGLLAVAALQTLFLWLVPRIEGSAAGILVAVRFLTPSEILFVIAIGGLAGLAGAILSLRREELAA